MNPVPARPTAHIVAGRYRLTAARTRQAGHAGRVVLDDQP